MKHRVSPATLIATVALLFSLGGTAVAATQHRIAPLHIQLRAGQSVTRCTSGIPDAWTAADWVYVNGEEAHSTSGGAGLYFAGNGTMVLTWAVPHNGPICARAMTWLPAARVLVTFKVLRG